MVQQYNAYPAISPSLIPDATSPRRACVEVAETTYRFCLSVDFANSTGKEGEQSPPGRGEGHLLRNKPLRRQSNRSHSNKLSLLLQFFCVKIPLCINPICLHTYDKRNRTTYS